MDGATRHGSTRDGTGAEVNIGFEIADGASPIRLGRWQDVLSDVECDALICDPPYSAKTHDGSDAAVDFKISGANRKQIGYTPFTPDDVAAFVASWSPRVKSWMAIMTDDILGPAWRAAFLEAGRCDFAPVPILQHKCRLSGDGPGSGAVYLMVARPRQKRFLGWGSLPCWYHSRPEKSLVMGAKPLGLMRAIVRDYSRPGDLVCDPFVGSGTTAIAALSEGRRFVGSEQKPEHHAIATARLARGYTPDLF